MARRWFNGIRLKAQSKIWARRSFKVAVYGVLGLSIITVSGQLLLPLLERYQPTIEDQVSQAMKTRVRFTRFKAHWVGLEPDITIDGLKVYHPQQADTVILEIPHIHIELALLQSILQWDWRLDAQASGVQLNVVQQETGAWAVKELLALGKSRLEVRERALTWILKQAEWQFSDVNLAIHPYQQPVLLLTEAQLTNRNRAQFHDFRLSARLNQQPIKLFADIKSAQNPLIFSSWQGRVYAKVTPQAWLPWLKTQQLANGLTLSDLTVGGEFWLKLKNGMAEQVIAQLDAPSILATYQKHNYRVQQLAGLLTWQQQKPELWQVVAEQLQGFINQRALPLSTLSVEKKSTLLTIAGGKINLEPLALLAQEAPTPTVLKNWLIQAKPSGHISNVAVQLTINNDSTAKIHQVSAVFDHLSAVATNDYSGFKNISGWLNHTEQGGSAAIHIDNGELDLRQVYRVPTPVENLNATLQWQQLADDWQVASNVITVKNSDTHGHAVLTLTIPKNDFSAAKMKLLASIYDGKLGSVWRYVPWPSAGDDTLAWLKSALISGEITRGDFLYDGVLIDAANRPPSSMQMNFAVKNGVLAYAPEWPILTQLNANIGLYNRSLTIEAQNSQIYETIIRQIKADIPELNHPQLHINADLDSTGEDILRLFKETPLKNDAGRVADLLTIRGEVAGSLNLDMPLASNSVNDDIKINVTAELPGNPIILRQASDFDLWLSGNVNYQTGFGLTSQPLRGFFLGQPVSVKMLSVLNSGDVAAVQIQANGQLTPTNLKPWLGDLTQSMTGVTEYKAVLTVPITDEPVHLALNSDLVGWTINLPEPLAKKNEATLFHFEMELESEREQNAYFNLGSRLQSVFALQKGKITRGLVQLGQQQGLGDMPKEGLWVNGHLSSLNIDDWLPWLRPQASNIQSKNVSAVLPELESFNVDVDKMSYMGYLLHDVRLGLEPEENQAWRLQIVSDDLSGEALFPHNPQQAMTVNLQTLNLPFVTDPHYSLKSAKSVDDWAIPKMNIAIADLSLKAWPKLAHSQVKTQLIPTSKGIRLNQIVVNNPTFSIEGAMDWQWRGLENTTYSGQINIPNIANLFSAFNATPVLNSQQAVSQLSLQWLGNPTDLGLGSLNGQLLVDLKKGRVLNLNRMASISRLLGVLDSDNFKRRLKFDFSDITQKGLAYDDIHFESEIERGIMKNQLAFHSPSLNAQGQGTVNLVTKDVEQFFEISVPMSSAVPYAAAVVAGPIVGGALVAAEAVFDNSITKMTTLHYKVAGSWQNPTVERMKNPVLPWRKWFKTKKKTP